MALRRPISRALTCNNCQKWILRSFIASIGGHTTFQPIPLPTHGRSFSRTARGLNEARERIQKQASEEHPLNEINDEASQVFSPNPESALKQPTNEHVPWYLQVHQPISQAESPLAARQRLPDLPEYAPPILQPLLEHVSVELGMDDLSLLDLRSLDPPPALGTNLLMIVGTARSEKHLHVSADRLCRWLRTQYKLTPYADGLLGRNELKLKMRRKAKRSRLLSAVGAKATADTEIDDGIRTGWVCVNVGRVEGGELPKSEEKMQSMDGVVGFGAGTYGSNIVVQMMTEEKRGEIDLENLWAGILKRASRNDIKESVEEGEGIGEQAPERNATTSKVEEDTASSLGQNPPTSATYFQNSQMSHPTTLQQARAYHTSARRLQKLATARSPSSSNDSIQPSSPKKVMADTEEQSISTRTLENLLTGLKSMDPKRGLEELGDDLITASQQLSPIYLGAGTKLQNEVEVSSSTFLRTFYGAMPTFPGSEHWHMHIDLLAHARRLGHRQVHSTTLIAQIMNMQIAGLVPEERSFKQVLRSALAPPGKAQRQYGVDGYPSDGKIHKILTLLEDMEACGYDPVSPDILEMLYQACVGQPQLRPNYEMNKILPHLKAASLRRHIQTKDWQAFWRTWRSYPQRFLPRTAEMYTVLFEAIGAGKLEDFRETMDILRTNLPEMGREEPPVVLEEHNTVAEAAMQALEYVEPRLKESEGESGVNKEWKGWYERCLGVLNQPR